MKPCRPFDQARGIFTGFDWPLRSPYTFLVDRVSIKSAIQSWQRTILLMAGAFALAALTACSAEPTGQPVTTAPIPADAKVLDDGCTMLGELACRFTSGVHGDAAWSGARPVPRTSRPMARAPSSAVLCRFRSLSRGAGLYAPEPLTKL